MIKNEKDFVTFKLKSLLHLSLKEKEQTAQNNKMITHQLVENGQII